MTEPAHDPYAGHRAHVGLVIRQLGLDAGTAERLRTAHEAAMRLNPATGDVIYVDGSPDPAAWLRGIEARDPARLGQKPRPAPASPAKPSDDLSAASLKDLFLAARGGDAAALAELGARTRRGDGTPPREGRPAHQTTGGEPTMTDLYIAARNGDASALDKLNAGLIKNTINEPPTLAQFMGHK